MMLSTSKFSAIPAALVLCMAGCTVVPTGPNVAVYPGTGKSFDDFRADDQVCRQYANDQIGGANAGQAANNNAVNSGAAGTLIGAVAGAALGGRQGAAVGAGTGLMMGSMQGAGASQYSSYGLQRRYDIGYQQCMYAKGNSVPSVGQTRILYRQVYSPNMPPPPPPPPVQY